MFSLSIYIFWNHHCSIRIEKHASREGLTRIKYFPNSTVFLAFVLNCLSSPKKEFVKKSIMLHALMHFMTKKFQVLNVHTRATCDQLSATNKYYWLLNLMVQALSGKHRKSLVQRIYQKTRHATPEKEAVSRETLQLRRKQEALLVTSESVRVCVRVNVQVSVYL